MGADRGRAASSLSNSSCFRWSSPLQSGHEFVFLSLSGILFVGSTAHRDAGNSTLHKELEVLVRSPGTVLSACGCCRSGCPVALLNVAMMIVIDPPYYRVAAIPKCLKEAIAHLKDNTGTRRRAESIMQPDGRLEANQRLQVAVGSPGKLLL